mgnify:CR=1 FL=1
MEKDDFDNFVLSIFDIGDIKTVTDAIEAEAAETSRLSSQTALIYGYVENSEEFAGNYVFEDGKLSKYLFDGGYIDIASGLNTAAYRFYVRDHLGSVRVVLDDDGNVLQQLYYHPFGGVWGDAGTNIGLQPWKYSGKEYDHRDGLDLYDYGARLYDPAAVRWTSPDPLCEKHYHISPYAFCNNNPIRYIDPDGRDEWDINRKGEIINHTVTEKHDAFYVVNEKGQRQADANFSMPYGSVEKTMQNTKGGKPYDVYQVRGDNYASGLFEFLANNTSVEWSQVQAGKSGKGGLNFLSTSHLRNEEFGMPDFMNKRLMHGYTLRSSIHSHTDNTPVPSGLEKGKDGDIQYAGMVEMMTGQNPSFMIYLPKNGAYIPYRSDSREEEFKVIPLGVTTVKARRR